MKTLEVKLRCREKEATYTGTLAVQALMILLKRGAGLGEHYTNLDLPYKEREIWRPIKKGERILGEVIWKYEDNVSGEVVRALESGMEILKEMETKDRELVSA
ncbi:hypothetical protein [Desulfurobacterium sp.]